jgi:isoamylase
VVLELPPPFGLRWQPGRSATISVPTSSAAARVEVCIEDSQGERRVALTDRLGSTWWGSVDVAPGDRYGIRVHGQGHDESKLLVDPWALAIDGDIDWLSDPGALRLGSGIDSAPFVPRSVVVDQRFDWGSSTRPRTPWSETILYEVHVRGATALHPDVDQHLRGTYAGFAHPAHISYLQKLGVTAVELLPIHHSVSEERLVALGLSNYWGYNTLGFLAPHQKYSSDTANAVNECKGMVKLLHEARIEVILDVVYNHTCEAGGGGPALSMRGLDPNGWYRSYDVTGCGNTLDLSEPSALTLTLDSLRYWVEEFQIDGFRFDLAPALGRTASGEFSQRSAFMMAVANDPVISAVKLIAEPWDVGPGGYQVGQFGAPWAEWNDRYRDLVRDHWRGGAPLGALARRLTGGPDLFQASNRRPWASINFVTAHDGFTLHDVVSYNDKHNDANGEENRDGTSNNCSWNHGIEGPTDDAVVLAERRQSVRAMLTTLLVSQGTPMLVAGDEFGRTQRGNNNAYCQDNEISWVDWAAIDHDLLAFTTALIAFRKSRSNLRRTSWLTSEQAEWFAPDGSSMENGRWDDMSAYGLGLLLSGADVGESDLLILMNDDSIVQEFVLPHPDRAWEQVFTSDPSTHPNATTADWGDPGNSAQIASRTIAIFQSTTRAV